MQGHLKREQVAPLRISRTGSVPQALPLAAEQELMVMRGTDALWHAKTSPEVLLLGSASAAVGKLGHAQTTCET